MKLTSGASEYFTLAACVFADQQRARTARSAIDQLRQSLGYHPQFEFKFNKCDRKHKEKFFDTIQPLEFQYHSFTLDKIRLMQGAMKQPKNLYRSVVFWTLENIFERIKDPQNLAHATIIFDSCGDRGFYDSFQKYAYRLAVSKLKTATVEVRALDSKDEGLLQLADMVCGAIGGSHKGNASCRPLLAKIAAKQGRLRRWPP